MRAAQDKLRAKICVNAATDRTAADACGFLASKIEPWKSGANDREVCASAVVKAAYIDEWRSLATDLDAFDARLAASAKQLIAAAPARPRIALVAVYDDNAGDRQNQLPGGRRADWLAARFRAEFASIGGLALPPKGWVDGDRAPAGYDMVIVGHMFKRTTVSLPGVDVSWTGITADGRQIETSSGSFPEAAAPAPPAYTPPPIPATPGLHLGMDSDHAGSICAGETTQLWLKSSEQLHVRVFDAYGKDGAMLIFPPNASRSDVVPTGRTIPETTVKVDSPEEAEVRGALRSDGSFMTRGPAGNPDWGRIAVALWIARSPQDQQVVLRDEARRAVGQELGFKPGGTGVMVQPALAFRWWTAGLDLGFAAGAPDRHAFPEDAAPQALAAFDGVKGTWLRGGARVGARIPLHYAAFMIGVGGASIT